MAAAAGGCGFDHHSGRAASAAGERRGSTRSIDLEISERSVVRGGFQWRSAATCWREFIHLARLEAGEIRIWRVLWTARARVTTTILRTPVDVDGDGKPDVALRMVLQERGGIKHSGTGGVGSCREEKDGNHECAISTTLTATARRTTFAHAAARGGFEISPAVRQARSRPARRFGASARLWRRWTISTATVARHPSTQCVVRGRRSADGPGSAHWGGIALGARDGKPPILALDERRRLERRDHQQRAQAWHFFTSPRVGRIAWKQHLVDDSWSQAHSLALADLDAMARPIDHRQTVHGAQWRAT